MGTSRRLRRGVVALALGGLAAAGLQPLVADARSPAESAAVSMVHGARRAAHLPGLRVDPRLGSIAKRQSDRMRAAGRIFHNRGLSAELSAADASWIVAGENVGVGASVEAVHRAFLASPAHRRNILGRDYDAIAIAVVTGEDGSVYVTQIFARFGAPARSASDRCSRSVVAEDGSVVPASFYGC